MRRSGDVGYGDGPLPSVQEHASYALREKYS